jgi:toxin ParE1/3/4
VARVELAPAVFDDFNRFFDHMALAMIGEIMQAIQILTHSPLIGRDTVFVLALRRQREAGYKRDHRSPLSM